MPGKNFEVQKRVEYIWSAFGSDDGNTSKISFDHFVPKSLVHPYIPLQWDCQAEKKSSGYRMTHVISLGLIVRIRCSQDTRSLIISQDATKFGQTYLSKFGWDPSKGLGTTGDGRTSHIKVAQKLDMLGIGSAHTNDPNGIAWKQNKEFEALLKRLNDGLEQDETTDVKDENLAAEHVGEEQEKKRKRTEQIEDGAEQIKRKKKSPQPEEENVAQVVVAHQPSTVAAVRVTASRPMAYVLKKKMPYAYTLLLNYNSNI